MDVKLELKSILEEILVKPITDAELDLSWDELDLDSLGIIELVMSVEDRFNTKIEYQVLSKNNIKTANQLADYLLSQQ